MTRRKLKELVDHGLLNTWQPSRYEQNIYYLTKHGAKELEYRCGDLEIKTYQRSNKSVHQTIISEVYVQFQNIDDCKIRAFHLNQKLRDIIPDAVMQIDMHNESVDIYLEADRGTESAQYMRDVKLEKYRQHYRHLKMSPPVPVLLIIVEQVYRKQLMARIISQYRLPALSFTLEEFVLAPEHCLQALISVSSHYKTL